MKTNRIMVLIVSQQILFRQGLELVFSSAKDIGIFSNTDFSNGIAFALEESPPDVAIIDIDGHSDSGMALGRRLKQRMRSIGIIMLTSNPNDTQFFQALKAQAAGYLSKEIIADQLIEAIRRVARGDHIINESLMNYPNVADKVLQQFQELSSQSETEGLISALTTRETEILNCIAQGHLNKQIAIILGVSEQTVKNHVTSVLRKLNANARTEAVVVALKKGIISIA